nr:3-hydroxyacyl-CoA dehydrogenase, NAD binding domain protein [Rhodococcus sp. JVH1]
MGVIGGGTMGAGIAEVVARAGDTVTILERDITSANAATGPIQSSLARAVKSGRLDNNASADIFARINVTLGIEDPAREARQDSWSMPC